MSKKMRKTLLIGAAFVATVPIISAWIWLTKPNPSSDNKAPLELAEETTVVRYDGATFSPQVIKVKAGSKVWYVNQSRLERPMYVASDDHPTHEKYAGFDAATVNGKFPAPGENFEFVFEKKGRWSYHDHNLPSATGTVIVE
mgnify:CR=1 FL=1